MTDSKCGCNIEVILESSFSSMVYSEKLKTIEEGPPKHILNINTKLKSCIRHFGENVYKSEQWLCGCKALNKLFCWPCLLFSKEENVWNTTGYDDLNNIYRSGKRHRNSTSHILSEKSLLLFGKNQIEISLSSACRFNTEMHNERVKINRQIVGNLINVTCLLGKLGLPFRANDENGVSTHKGNYVEFVNELAKNDNVFKTHLEKSTVFRGLSPDTQNDLILSVGEVMSNKIKLEISEAYYVALILDEVSDVSMKSQLAATFRYVSKDGSIEERFIQFVDISEDRSASSLLNHTLQILDEFDCRQKLVALTYDGAAVIAQEHNDLQTELQEYCKSAHFIHCYAHKLNLVLSQSTSYIKEVKGFFINLSSFSDFFSKSTKKIHAFENVVTKRIAGISPTWNFESRLVETISGHKQDLEMLFETMVRNESAEWDQETTICARGLTSLLHDFDFNFFLSVFSSIFPLSEHLFKILQTKFSDIKCCNKKIGEFESQMQKMRDEFDLYWNNMKGLIDINEPPRKRMHLDSIQINDKKDTYAQLFYEILDVITLNITHRFSGLSKLQFLNLLDLTQFTTFEKVFPQELFSGLLETYGLLFDSDRLKSELSVMYVDPDMKHSSVFKMHEYIVSHQLHTVFPELTKMLRLILTIPAISYSPERSVSCLNRIKTYLRNSQKQERLSTLALMNIESSLLESMRSSPTFEENVINVFANLHTCRIDLNFKI